MGMVVIQPYISMLKLKKIKTKFLRCTGYLNIIKKKLYKARFIANSSSCTTTELSKVLTSCLTAVKNMLSSTVKRYMRDPVKTYFGLLKIQVKFFCDFAQVRNNCFNVDNMKKKIQDIHIDSIMTFLRQINLFNKI